MGTDELLNATKIADLFRRLPIALCLVGRDGRLIVANEAHAQLAGRPLEELSGVHVADVHEQGGRNVERDFRQFDAGLTVPEHELEIRGRLYLVSSSPVLDGLGQVIAISVAHFDITEKKALERKNQRIASKLRALATHDHLTRSFNRREFDKALKAHVAALRRFARGFSLILFDIDHFKAFNDSYGHLDGDRCLTSVANAAERVLRIQEARLFRYGGEEFAVLVKVADPEVAKVIAERVCSSVRSLAITHISGVNGIVTVSCGVASAGGQGAPDSSALDVVERTGAALHRAKQSGRDQTAAFEDAAAGKVETATKSHSGRRRAKIVNPASD